jgi:hypothetical protein
VARVDALLAKYPLLMGELSYRPGLTCTDAAQQERLCPVWRALLLKYPQRFLIGSDTWVNQRWLYYDALMQGYRGWLGELPQKLPTPSPGAMARACLNWPRRHRLDWGDALAAALMSGPPSAGCGGARCLRSQRSRRRLVLRRLNAPCQAGT